MATIFYSWQTDLPNRINRSFIREALDIAAREIAKDLALDEPPRVDQDTQGIPGSPEIGNSILTKIDSCSMFVADLTLIRKGSPNPNVLIEYGYALKSKGYERIIGVMNDAFGSPDDLPFDLKVRRWPMRYNLAKDAAPDMRKFQKKLLADGFRDAFKTAIKAGLFPAEFRSVYEDRGLIVL